MEFATQPTACPWRVWHVLAVTLSVSFALACSAADQPLGVASGDEVPPADGGAPGDPPDILDSCEPAAFSTSLAGDESVAPAGIALAADADSFSAVYWTNNAFHYQPLSPRLELLTPAHILPTTGESPTHAFIAATSQGFAAGYDTEGESQRVAVGIPVPKDASLQPIPEEAPFSTFTALSGNLAPAALKTMAANNLAFVWREVSQTTNEAQLAWTRLSDSLEALTPKAYVPGTALTATFALGTSVSEDGVPVVYAQRANTTFSLTVRTLLANGTTEPGWPIASSRQLVGRPSALRLDDPSGRTLVAWTEQSGDGLRTHVAAIDPDGSLVAGEALYTGSDDQAVVYAPQLVRLGQKTLLVTSEGATVDVYPHRLVATVVRDTAQPDLRFEPVEIGIVEGEVTDIDVATVASRPRTFAVAWEARNDATRSAGIYAMDCQTGL